MVEKAYFIIFVSLVKINLFGLPFLVVYNLPVFIFSLKKKKSLAQGQLSKPPDSYKMKNLVLGTVILSFFMEYSPEQT